MSRPGQPSSPSSARRQVSAVRQTGGWKETAAPGPRDTCSAGPGPSQVPSLPFHSVRASSWWSRGWPSFPDPPLDHFRARDTNATRSGELGSIKLNSFARLSANKTDKQTRGATGFPTVSRRRETENNHFAPKANKAAASVCGGVCVPGRPQGPRCSARPTAEPTLGSRPQGTLLGLSRRAACRKGSPVGAGQRAGGQDPPGPPRGGLGGRAGLPGGWGWGGSRCGWETSTERAPGRASGGAGRKPHRAARRPPRPPPSPVTPRPAWTNRRRCFATDTGKGRGRRKQGSGPSPGDRPELGGGSGSGATVTQQTYGAAVGAAADPGGEPERSPSPPRPLTWPWLKKSRAPEHMSSRASACLLCDMYLRQRGLRSGPAPPVCRPHAPGLGG